MENDVDHHTPGCEERIPGVEELNKLRIETHRELGEWDHIIGYSQEKRSVLRSPGFAWGYMCRFFSEDEGKSWRRVDQHLFA